MSGPVTQPEALLWALLDQIGLPFRETVGDLVVRFGTTPSLWTTSPMLRLGTRALIPDLSDFSLLLIGGFDPTLPPKDFTASFRRHHRRRPQDFISDDRTARNFADLRDAVEQRLGQGEDASVSNTLSRRWRFGRGLVQITAFPPALNAGWGVNQRHQKDPMSQHEASLSIQSGYLLPLSAEALAWLARFERLGVPVGGVPFSSWGPRPLWHDWPSELGPTPRPGYGPSLDGAGFVVINGGLVKTIARADLIAVRLDVLTPAKGSGGATLGLDHAPKGVLGVRPHRLDLEHSSYTPTALRAEAEVLAAALGLALNMSEEADC